MQNTRSQIFSVFSQLILPCLAAAIWMILVAVSFSLTYSLDDFPIPPWILFYMTIILPPLVIILLVERRKHQRSIGHKKVIRTHKKMYLLGSRLRRGILNILMILSLTVLIVVIFYFLDLWFIGLWQKNTSLPFWSLTDLFFIQGIMLIIFGFITLPGRAVSLREKFGSTSAGIYWEIGNLRLFFPFIFSGAIMICNYYLNL